MNGNTYPMSDLTDNQFYLSDERIWLCIRLNNASLSRPEIIFSDDAHFDVGGYVNKQNYSIWGHSCQIYQASNRQILEK